MSLRSFLDARRVAKGTTDWNLTGMGGADTGSYKVEDDDYDQFLDLFHAHSFGPRPAASSLLERHRDVGPLLIDLDFRYPAGGALVRRFTDGMVRRFIAEYISVLIYFSDIEALPTDRPIRFFMMVKPSAETDGRALHKDGIHIQCPDIITNPKIQYAVRGFLLNRGTIGSVFASTGLNNAPEDVFDVSVIHRNNWFLYGACKTNKAPYSVKHVWRLNVADIVEALGGGTPSDFADLVEAVEDMFEEDTAEDMMLGVPESEKNAYLLKELSIRRNISTSNMPAIRAAREKEWAALLGAWGAGKAVPDRGTTNNTAMTNWTTPVGALGGGGGGGACDDGETCSVITSTFEEGRRVSSAYSAEEIAEAYKIARQCLNPEKRAGRYADWINLAILLRNISNTDESFNVWMEISRRVPGYDGRMTDAEYRAKWNSVRVDSTKRLTMGSLMYWAEDDAPETLKAIKSETNRDWIMNYAKDTHVNVACFVVRMYSHQFRCSIGSKRGAEWFYYNKDNHSWRHLKTPNELRARLSGEVRNQYIEADREFGRRIQMSINNESEGKMNEEKRKKILQIERQLEMASFKDNVLKECAEKFYDEDFVSRLNCNPYIVGVANGVLELDWQDPADKRYKVRFRDGLPEDMITFQMGRSEPDLDPIPYIPWSAVDVEDRRGLEGFFERIYPDSVLRNYVLTLLSSCLEGQNREQRFYIMQGRGSNGKSMIQTLMRYTFGDYQTSLQTTALTRKRPESGAANPDMIVTKCKRYIYMGEPDQNEKINTARMKQLSGEDIVEARGLFSDQEKFKMMGKMFLACNDLPPVSSMDDGTWRRIVTVPHLATFVNPGKPTNPEANIYVKDLHLEQKLRKWRTAFLSLLVHYYENSYLVGGLQEPDCVTAASNKYKQDNDSFAAFLSDNFVLEPGAGPVSINTIKEIYKEWDRTQLGRTKLVQKQIVERMRAVCDRRSTEREFWGIRQLNPDEETQNVDGASIGSLASL